MIAWWPGDSNANDIRGGDNGTLQGGATFGSGAVDQAFSLGGNGDFVEVPDSDLWAFGTNDFTIDLWATFATSCSSQLNNPNCVFVATDEGGGPQNKWLFGVGPLSAAGGATVIFFHINSPTSPDPFLARSQFTPVAGRWYHFAITKRSGLYTIYVDGAPVSSEANSTPVPNVNAPLLIGKGENALTFPGLLDEVEIFNRALDPSEIEAIFSAGSAGKCKNCVDPITDCPRPPKCQEPVCVSAAGGGTMCDVQNGPDDVPCGDAGTDCTKQDTCLAGLCHDNGFKDAGTVCGDPSSGQCDNPDSCNGSGICQANHVADGMACDDGDACTYSDTCNSGGVCAGTPIPCTDDQCNTRTCNGTASCTVTPKTGQGCDDGDACTYSDTCNSGGVCAGTPIPCTDDQCNTRTCNGTASCTVTPKTGQGCDDGDACTYSDTCNSGGVCLGMSTCGDGIVNTACGEECDLGPASADSGNCPPDAGPPTCASCTRSCSSDCKLIGRCTGTFGCCTAASDCPPGQGCCGNGIKENPPEECDDGNLLSGDTCTPQCTSGTGQPFTCCPLGAEVAGSTVAVRQKLKLMKLGPPVGNDKFTSPGETILLPGQDVHPCTEGVSYCLESDAGIVYGPNPVDVAHPAIPGNAFGPKPPCVDITTPARQVRATFKDKTALVSEPDGIDRLQMKSIASQPNKYKHKVSGRNLDLSGVAGKMMLRQTLVVGDTCMTSSLTCVDKNATTKVCTPAP
jgi:cysteine-rich repeat protein